MLWTVRITILMCVVITFSLGRWSSTGSGNPKYDIHLLWSGVKTSNLKLDPRLNQKCKRFYVSNPIQNDPAYAALPAVISSPTNFEFLAPRQVDGAVIETLLLYERSGRGGGLVHLVAFLSPFLSPQSVY